MILAEFIRWYYYRAPIDIIAIWQRFLGFSLNFFGVRYHLATFFRPWRLIVVQYDEPSLIRRFFLNVAGKVIGISIGMVMRFFSIVAGVGSFLLILGGGIVIELLWLLLPALLLFGFIQGIYLVL